MKTSKATMKRHEARNMILDSQREVNLLRKEKRTITTRTGKSVVTDMTDAEAVGELEKLYEAGKVSGGFPQSLIKNQHRLSEEQTKWVHVLVVQAKQPKSAKDAALKKVKVDKLNAVFDAAGRTLKFPVISLETKDKIEVSVYRASEKSKTPGAFQVTNGRGWRKPYFGKIMPDGVMSMRDTVSASVKDLLMSLASDPYKTMTESGHLSGRCSCCGKQLDDPKSVARGIGPICARAFGMK